MVVAPELLELPSSPTPSSTSTRPTSVGHELTTEITSTLPDPRLDETQVPGALIPQEKEKQADGPADGHDLAQGSPPTVSASVQFIGINYVPPESTDGQTTPLPAPPPASPPHPLPWESRPSPTSDGHVVIGLSTFVPKPPAAKRGVPVSSYYFGPPPQDSAYFTPPVGQIGVHHPREIVRVERDYSGGEIVQFSSTYPTEFEGRITPTQFLESINAINEILISAYSLWYSVFDNCVEIFSLQLSRLVLATHYEREMGRLKRRVDELNHRLFNPVGLNMLWPRKVGFIFLEIEYY